MSIYYFYRMTSDTGNAPCVFETNYKETLFQNVLNKYEDIKSSDDIKLLKRMINKDCQLSNSSLIYFIISISLLTLLLENIYIVKLLFDNSFFIFLESLSYIVIL